MKILARVVATVLGAGCAVPAFAQYRPGNVWKDATGRIVAETTASGTRLDYEYESDGRRVLIGGRLVAVEKLDGTVLAYAYDASGRRIHTRITRSGEPTRFVDHKPRPIPEAPSAARAEPMRLASVSMEDVRRYAAKAVVRDEIGRLTSVTTDEGTTQYDYFPDDDRPLILAVTLPNGDREVYDKKIALNAYGAFATLAQPPGDPFAQIGQSQNRIAFGGYFFNPLTRLYLTPSGRWYDPEVGRFLQQDSFLGKIDEPPSLHRFTYAHNNPTRFTDPTGHCVLTSCSPLVEMEKNMTPEMRQAHQEGQKAVVESTIDLVRLAGRKSVDLLVGMAEAQRRALIMQHGSIEQKLEEAERSRTESIQMADHIGQWWSQAGYAVQNPGTAIGEAKDTMYLLGPQGTQEVIWDSTANTAGLVSAVHGSVTAVQRFALAQSARSGAAFIVAEEGQLVPIGGRLSQAEVDAMLQRLPVRHAGDKTSGTLAMNTSRGGLDLKSGVQGPGDFMPETDFGFNVQTRTHVEGHGAAAMRLSNATEGHLVLNNVPCGRVTGCASQLPNMLPPGSTMHVYGPGGYYQPFTGLPDPRPFPMRVTPWVPGSTGSFLINNPTPSTTH